MPSDSFTLINIFINYFGIEKNFAKILLMQSFAEEWKHCLERARYYEYGLDIEIKSKAWE